MSEKKYLAKIIAKDPNGLQVISACCSDGKVKVDEIKFLKKNKLFLLSIERLNKENDKKSVVLIEYPRKDVWAVGFATKENKGEMANKLNKRLINVFVPTTPNPTSGFLLMLPYEDVIFLNMTFEEASKFIVSAGTSSGKN